MSESHKGGICACFGHMTNFDTVDMKPPILQRNTPLIEEKEQRSDSMLLKNDNSAIFQFNIGEKNVLQKKSCSAHAMG